MLVFVDVLMSCMEKPRLLKNTRLTFRRGAAHSNPRPRRRLAQYELSEGDTVFFDQDATGLRLKFLKLSVMSDMAGLPPAIQIED